MRARTIGVVLFLTLAERAPSAPIATTLEATYWVVEQMPGGTVRFDREVLTIDDAKGCTVWLRAKLTGPVEISYEIKAVAAGGPNDRVSDVNCFWMATDPSVPGGQPFASDARRRTGEFAAYDSLRLYYASIGGNGNTTTRFRRYAGNGEKPLLPEHDLKDARFLLQPNHAYKIKIVSRHGRVEFWREGERIFTFNDPNPLSAGWFAFRTVQSHLEIRKFRVVELAR